MYSVLSICSSLVSRCICLFAHMLQGFLHGQTWAGEPNESHTHRAGKPKVGAQAVLWCSLVARSPYVPLFGIFFLSQALALTLCVSCSHPLSSFPSLRSMPYPPPFHTLLKRMREGRLREEDWRGRQGRKRNTGLVASHLLSLAVIVSPLQLPLISCSGPFRFCLSFYCPPFARTLSFLVSTFRRKRKPRKRARKRDENGRTQCEGQGELLLLVSRRLFLPSLSSCTISSWLFVK